MRSASDSTLLLATRSRDKAREIRDLLADAPVRLLTLDEAGLPPDPAEDAIEAFDTYTLNAHAKAAYFMQRSGLPTLADDSGLNVDALDGAPGVHSRRFAACTSADSNECDEANNRLLLQRLADVPDPQRSAHYTCAALLLTPGGLRVAALATCSGTILHAPAGDGGFGYDPLFFDPVLSASFAQITIDAKHSRSHRARAFRALAANLLSALDHPSASR